jgi:hypothetical protein
MNCNYEGTNCKFCEIDCNEKAPVTEQGASKINQLHNNTNEELLKEFIELRERFQPLYRETGLISIENGGGIMLTPEMFFDTFQTYKTKPRNSKGYPEELYAYYNNIKFFCVR